MQVSWSPFKIIHSDDIMNLDNAGGCIPYMGARYEIYPVQEGKLPIMLRVTYRVKQEQTEKVIFSIIGEERAVLTFEKGENPVEAIKLFIGNVVLQLEVHWEDKTKQTSIFGQTLRPLPVEIEQDIIKSIMEIAEQNGLL